MCFEPFSHWCTWSLPGPAASAMKWDTTGDAEAGSGSKFHVDKQEVCNLNTKALIMLVNCSDNEYVAEFTPKPLGYRDDTQEAERTWLRAQAPEGSVVVRVTIPPNSTYFMVGETRNEWMHRPVYTGKKISIRKGFNLRPWHDPPVQCQRLIAALSHQ